MTSSYAQKTHKYSRSELDSLGYVMLDEGKHKKAETFFKASIERAEESSFIDSLYWTSNYGLASLYDEIMQFQKALEQSEKTLEVCKQVFEDKHIAYAVSYDMLGISYKEMGLYVKAEKTYLEAIKRFEEKKSEEGYAYLLAQRDLANLYIEQGLFKRGERTLKALIKELQNHQEEEYIDLHNIIQEDLANSYAEQGRSKEAEQLYLQVKDRTEEMYGKKNTDYSSICNNLGSIYIDLGKEEEAEKYFLQAIKIDKKLLGDKSLFYADDINNLATLYSYQGKYKKAIDMYLEAYAIYKQELGVIHSRNTLSAFNIAEVHYLGNNFSEAEKYFDEALELTRKQVKAIFPALSEEERQQFYQSAKGGYDSFIDFAISYYPENKKIARKVFDQQLFTKGVIFSSTQKLRKRILESEDPELIMQYLEWKQKREDYIQLLQLPNDKRPSDKKLADLARQINELERNISKKSTLFEKDVNQSDYTWRQVQQKLSSEEALVEMIRLERFHEDESISDTVYVALILTKETTENPLMITISEGAKLEKDAYNAYRNHIQFQIEDEDTYNSYWHPIAKALKSVSGDKIKRLYFSPDGIYHKINLNTIRDPNKNEYLIERLDINLLTSSRDLIEYNKEKKLIQKNYKDYEVYLLGYPSYRLGYQLGTENAPSNSSGERGLSGLQRLVGRQNMIPVLEGTKKETNQINDLLGKREFRTILLQNEEANEANVKSLQSPFILHFATHGFFIPKKGKAQINDMFEAEEKNLLAQPLLRCGLLLAGCQNPQVGEDDGILTAKEAMNLNLDNTFLVVLSACETGLGDVTNGEGVYGLQRAFRQAGAETIIMSLWKVSDEATQLLMNNFYAALLEEKNKKKAFRKAQLQLKESFPSPYYWGAFVMVGE